MTSRDAESGAQSPAARQTGGWQRRWVKVLATLALLTFAGLFFAAEYALHHAEPILRQRILETLSARFNAPVALDSVQISLLRGVEVSGAGLRIPFARHWDAAHEDAAPAYPLLTVQHFAFRMSLGDLYRRTAHVAEVHVDGMELHIPAAGKRALLFGTHSGESSPESDAAWPARPRVALLVQELHCTDVTIFLESGKPGKVPLELRIARLDLHDVGEHRAMLYDAELTNPKPHGTIHAVGHFGPWGGQPQPAGQSQPAGQPQPQRIGQPADPGLTPLDGEYSFDHADLNSIKGIGGMLSSSGHFDGVLDRIAVDGEADVPNFSLDISNHDLTLHTRFHAIVDGTSGDTFLQPVYARLGKSEFTVTGKVVKAGQGGHDIQLDVHIPHGRMQDFLRLAAKTNPPLMNGDLSMEAQLHIPPGEARVAAKLAMTGDFQLAGVQFNNPKMQDRIDGLSARAQGKPQDVAQVSRNRETEAHSTLAARFRIAQGVMEVTDVRYAIPGALVALNGVYSMDGRLFEFKGHVRTQATASQMVTGWKSWLLKPMDSLLSKDGAGVVLPVEITGTEGQMHLGLAMNGTDDTPRQMLAEVRGKEHDQRELRSAQGEFAQADAEDAAAARAPTLAAAQQLHNAAVRHRAEAQSRAQAAGASRQ